MSKKHVVVLDIISLTPAMLHDTELTPNIQNILKDGSHAKVKPCVSCRHRIDAGDLHYRKTAGRARHCV